MFVSVCPQDSNIHTPHECALPWQNEFTTTAWHEGRRTQFAPDLMSVSLTKTEWRVLSTEHLRAVTSLGARSLRYRSSIPSRCKRCISLLKCPDLSCGSRTLLYRQGNYTNTWLRVRKSGGDPPLHPMLSPFHVVQYWELKRMWKE